VAVTSAVRFAGVRAGSGFGLETADERVVSKPEGGVVQDRRFNFGKKNQKLLALNLVSRTQYGMQKGACHGPNRIDACVHKSTMALCVRYNRGSSRHVAAGEFRS
jgi:hypothetical protein